MAARLPRGGSLIVAACLLIAAGLTLAVPRVHSNVALFICIGIISGLPGAAVMSLPSRVLDVPTRAVGMGIFYWSITASCSCFPQHKACSPKVLTRLR